MALWEKGRMGTEEMEKEERVKRRVGYIKTKKEKNNVEEKEVK